MTAYVCKLWKRNYKIVMKWILLADADEDGGGRDGGDEKVIIMLTIFIMQCPQNML